MRPAQVRRLTAGERELAREMFGAALEPGRVRLLSAPVLARAFVAGPGLIVWPTRSAWADFSAPEVPLRAQAVFVHELTHVWQAQQGINLLFAKLRAGDDARAYGYDLAGAPDFSQLNIEQQAMVVEHAFLAARGARTPFAAAQYEACLPSWRRG